MKARSIPQPESAHTISCPLPYKFAHTRAAARALLFMDQFLFYSLRKKYTYTYIHIYIYECEKN